MTRSAPLLLSALLLTLPGMALAEDARSHAQVEVSLLLGGRAGWYSDDSVVLGGHLSLGWRLEAWRLGLTGRVLGSRSFQVLGIDAGAYFSVDLVSLTLDRTLSAGAFFRLDLLVRDTPALGRVAIVPLPSIGLRAAGISLSLAAGPELGVRLGAGETLGVTGEVRLGVEFVEIAAFAARLAEGQARPPP